MAKAGPLDSPEIPSDLEDNTPELPSSSTETETESSTSEDVTLASTADLRGSSASGQCSAEPPGSSCFDQPSCSHDYQPSCSRDYPPSSSKDQEPSSTLLSGNLEEIKAEIKRKLNERAAVSYNILLVAADVSHHVRSVCDIGQMLHKAGHYVCLAHTLGHRIIALDHNIEFMEIDDTLFDVFVSRPSDWLCKNLDKFHAQPDRLWKDWTEDEAIELGRLVYEFNVTNRIFELQMCKLEKVYDLIIGNFETRYPCTYFSKIPFVPVTFMNPLSLHRGGPPPFSGYPTKGDQEQARTYEEAQLNIFDPLVFNLRKWWRSLGIPFLDEERWWVEEPRKLGIYRYPQKLEYTNIGPKHSKEWFRIDPDCEKYESTKFFEFPREVREFPGKKIYISLGNLGQAEPEWMTKFLELLTNIPHGFIYSQGTKIVQTPKNVWASQNLDDAVVIPKVDLVITHGGCNALMQIIYHRKPMLVIPFFLDQYDNAQRVVECGVGRRLDTTCLNTTTISEAIEATLRDKSILPRLAEISKDMQISDSRLQLRYKIEEICREYRERREERNRD